MAGDKMDPILWNDFWTIACDTKLHELCCSAYTNRRRRWARWYSILVIVIPAVSAGLTVIDKTIPVIGCIITSVLGILTKIQPLALQSESELAKLNEYQEEFAKISVQLEDLFHSFRLESQVDNLDIKNRLQDIKSRIAKIKPDMDKLVRKVPTEKKLNEQANEYAKNKFLTT